MKNHYIHATIELMQSTTDTQSVLDGLKKTLESKGHVRLHASILRGVVRILETTTESAGASVVLSKESDKEMHLEAIKKSLQDLEETDEPQVVIDTTLIGGFILKSNNKIIDRSYKTALTNLYRSVTK